MASNEKKATTDQPAEETYQRKPLNPDEKGEASPAQEWGERHDTGKTIESGGKSPGPAPNTQQRQS